MGTTDRSDSYRVAYKTDADKMGNMQYCQKAHLDKFGPCKKASALSGICCGTRNAASFGETSQQPFLEFNGPIYTAMEIL